MLRASQRDVSASVAGSRGALRCVSKHEGANISASSSLETRVRSFEFAEALELRAPQDEDDHHGETVFTFQTADLVPAARFLRPGFALSLHSPQRRGGGAPRVVRVLARHPLGLHVTRQARRWRGALRPSEDARLPALHRGGFWLRCRAFPHRTCVRIGPSELLAPGRSARRRLSVPPGAAVTSRCRGTPRLAPRSGRLENTPLSEQGWRIYTSGSISSQHRNSRRGFDLKCHHLVNA